MGRRAQLKGGNGFSFQKTFCLSQGSESFTPEGSVPDRSEQSCALAWATHAATGQGLGPEALDWPHEAVSLESPGWFLAPAATHKPITSFSSCQERGTLVLKYFKSGGERSTARKGKCLRPAALSTVCILAHSPTNHVTGPSLRQNLCPAPTAAVYPLRRHWRISIPSYRILCSMAKRSLDWELDSKIHAPETQWHLFLLWKKRDWREQGPPIPPVKFRHDVAFPHPLHPQEAPLRLHRAPTAAHVATRDERAEAVSWNPCTCCHTQPTLQEACSQAEAAPDFKTGCPGSAFKGCFPGFTRLLWSSLLHPLVYTEQKSHPSLPQPKSSLQPYSSAFTPCRSLFSFTILP